MDSHWPAAQVAKSKGTAKQFELEEIQIAPKALSFGETEKVGQFKPDICAKRFMWGAGCLNWASPVLRGWHLNSKGEMFSTYPDVIP